jgi:hypothetical protein
VGTVTAGQIHQLAATAAMVQMQLAQAVLVAQAIMEHQEVLAPNPEAAVVAALIMTDLEVHIGLLAVEAAVVLTLKAQLPRHLRVGSLKAL